VRLFKLLLIPAAVLLSVAVATPAFANHVNDFKAVVTCDTTHGQFCIEVTGNVVDNNAARVLHFKVFATGSDTSLGEVTVDVPANSPGHNNIPIDVKKCFPAFTSSATSFVVKYEGFTGGTNALTVTDAKGVEIKAGAAVADNLHPCTVAASPSPAQSPSPSPSASANTTTTLAQTGGFDYRFPLIGLTLLVVGATLFLVSASRGRSASK
jgi:hypothetical protein